MGGNETCSARWWLPQDPFQSGHFHFARLGPSGKEQELNSAAAATKAAEQDKYKDKPFPLHMRKVDTLQFQDMKPGARKTLSAELPEYYQKQLLPGEKYSAICYARANEMEASWRSESPNKEDILKRLNDADWPTKEMTEAKPGAPVFETTIDVPSTISLGNEQGKQDAVSLHATLQGDTPVVISTSQLWRSYLTFALGRPCPPPRQEDIEWMPFRDDELCAAGAYLDDAPDYEVVVGDSDNFKCLQPGKTWTVTTELIPCFDDYPRLQPGDLLVVWFNGSTAEWWDWGSPEDHKTTKVMLSGQWSGGGVTHPKDNDGRPPLLLPAAGRVTCHIIE